MMNNIMTDAELEAIGMTRTEWNRCMNEELEYTNTWAETVSPEQL